MMQTSIQDLIQSGVTVDPNYFARVQERVQHNVCVLASTMTPPATPAPAGFRGGTRAGDGAQTPEEEQLEQDLDMEFQVALSDGYEEVPPSLGAVGSHESRAPGFHAAALTSTADCVRGRQSTLLEIARPFRPVARKEAGALHIPLVRRRGKQPAVLFGDRTDRKA
eukprot:7611539-Lingulodinium_polyedra.AAC.1